jgi:hypothetical protein
MCRLYECAWSEVLFVKEFKGVKSVITVIVKIDLDHAPK